ELLVREAAALGRTPVVFEPRFDPRHNGGHDVQAGWRKYIDLDAIELVQGGSGQRLPVRALQRSEVAGFDALSAAWFERAHRITVPENRRHALIVRLNKTGLAVGAVHEGPAGLPGYRVNLPASAAVRAAAQQVQAQLGPYGAMHVRRGDMLAMKAQYPNLARDTQPGHIAAVLRAHLPAGSRVYVMTNERDPEFFAPLRREYEIVQFFDFPALKALLEGPAPDNFFLFEVEKLLFEQAATRIHTFTHPEGGTRIALSTDLGWA
ncbi:MAG: hypothetical protein KGK09_12405, partial [Burkholderiales bacterium]|nr:hypothetical protein [Burkholderiales bacterium]